MTGLRACSRAYMVWRTPRGKTLLQQTLEVLLVESNIAQYLGQQTRPDCFAGVKRHDCGAAVRVPEEYVAALPAHHREAVALEGSDDVCAADAGKTCHTATD